MGRICCCSIVCTWYWHGSWCHLWRCHATAIPGLVLGSSNGWWVYKGCTLNYLKSYWNGAHPRHSVMVLVLHTLNLLWSRNTKSNLAELFVWSDGRGAYWWQRWWQLKVIKCNHLPASSAMTSFRSFSVSSPSFGLVFSHIKTDKKGSLCSKHKLTEIVFCINLDRQCNLALESVFWHSVQQCKSAVLLELILGQLLVHQLVMSQK